jgi:uncharacterized protein YndB with AHSA1/START domain
MPGYAHVVEIKREAEETTTLFAESWHSDWRFLPSPPAGRTLYGCVIPPIAIADREAYEIMGFHRGWAICTEQLAALVEKI